MSDIRTIQSASALVWKRADPTWHPSTLWCMRRRQCLARKKDGKWWKQDSNLELNGTHITYASLLFSTLLYAYWNRVMNIFHSALSPSIEPWGTTYAKLYKWFWPWGKGAFDQDDSLNRWYRSSNTSQQTDSGASSIQSKKLLHLSFLTHPGFAHGHVRWPALLAL